MQRQQVKSSMLKSVAYDEATRILEAEYANGGIYQYLDVPPGTWDEFQRQEKIGVWFAANIRGKFTAKKMEPTDAPQDTQSAKEPEPPKAA